MEIDSDGWSNCHGKIVAQSVESDSFISPTCRKNVDGAGAVGNRYGSERTSVQVLQMANIRMVLAAI